MGAGSQSAVEAKMPNVDWGVSTTYGHMYANMVWGTGLCAACRRGQVEPSTQPQTETFLDMRSSRVLNQVMKLSHRPFAARFVVTSGVVPAFSRSTVLTYLGSEWG